MQTTIRKWGNSAGARLPANILRSVGININEFVGNHIFTECHRLQVKSFAFWY